MGLKTGIQWTDATWNPMTGCTKISKGCDHCYAFTLAQTKVRDAYLRGIPVKDTAANRADPFAPRFWEARLDQRDRPLRQSTRVICLSLDGRPAPGRDRESRSSGPPLAGRVRRS